MKKILIGFFLIIFSVIVINAKAADFETGSTYNVSFKEAGIGMSTIYYSTSASNYNGAYLSYYKSGDDVAYCIDPDSLPGHDSLKIERVLGTSSDATFNKHDAGILAIAEAGCSSTNCDYDEYRATSLALRAFTIGLFGYSRRIVYDYDLSGGLYSCSIIKLASEWAYANKDLANSVTGKNCNDQSCFRTYLTECTKYPTSSFRDITNTFNVEIDGNTSDNNIIKEAKRLFEIGLNAANGKTGSNAKGSVQIAFGKVTISKTDKTTVNTVPVIVRVKNYDSSKKINNIKFKCDNCSSNGINTELTYRSADKTVININSTTNLVKYFDANSDGIIEDDLITLELKLTKRNKKECKIPIKYSLSYTYESDGDSAIIGAELKPGYESQQRFYIFKETTSVGGKITRSIENTFVCDKGEYVCHQNEDGIQKDLKCEGSYCYDESGTRYPSRDWEEECQSDCTTDISKPECYSDTVGKITAPDDIKNCVIDKKDDAGNSYKAVNYVDNSYCSVFCKEDYASIDLQKTITDVECGRSFFLSSHIKGTKSCYVASPNTKDKKNDYNYEIDIDQYYSDVIAAQKKMIEGYDLLLRAKAAYEAASNDKFTDASDSGKCPEDNPNSASGVTLTVSYTGIEAVVNGHTVTTTSAKHSYTYGTAASCTNNMATCGGEEIACSESDGEEEEEDPEPCHAPTYECCGTTSCIAGTSAADILEEIENTKAEGEKNLIAGKEAYEKAIKDLNACTTGWKNDNDFLEKVEIGFKYNEYIGNNEYYSPYYDLLVSNDIDATLETRLKNTNSKINAWVESVDNKFTTKTDFSSTNADNCVVDEFGVNSCYGSIFKDEEYVVCSTSGCSQDIRTISKATFIEKKLNSERYYQTPTNYYQIGTYARIIVDKFKDSSFTNLTPIRNGLPISNKVCDGGEFDLFVKGIGEFYDVSDGVFGRLIQSTIDGGSNKSVGNYQKNINIDTFDGDYVCSYSTDCSCYTDCYHYFNDFYYQKNLRCNGSTCCDENGNCDYKSSQWVYGCSTQTNKYECTQNESGDQKQLDCSGSTCCDEGGNCNYQKNEWKYKCDSGSDDYECHQNESGDQKELKCTGNTCCDKNGNCGYIKNEWNYSCCDECKVIWDPICRIVTPPVCRLCEFECFNCIFDGGLSVKQISNTGLKDSLGKRSFGYNWITTTQIGQLGLPSIVQEKMELFGDKAEATVNEISEAGELIYGGDKPSDSSSLELSVVMNQDVIKYLKKYNSDVDKLGGYANESLTCYDDFDANGDVRYKKIYCYSEVIDELWNMGSVTINDSKTRIIDVDSRKNGSRNSGYWQLWEQTYSENALGGPAWK